MRETITLTIKVLAYMIVYGVLTILSSIVFFIIISSILQLTSNCRQSGEWGCLGEVFISLLMSGPCGFFIATILIGVLIIAREGNLSHLDDEETPTPAIDDPSHTPYS